MRAKEKGGEGRRITRRRRRRRKECRGKKEGTGKRKAQCGEEHVEGGWGTYVGAGDAGDVEESKKHLVEIGGAIQDHKEFVV